MKKYIDERVIDKIIAHNNIKVTADTTPEEMLTITKTIVFQAINSINIDALSEAVALRNRDKLRGHGI